MPQSDRVSMGDIAKRLGVSRATVSYALRGHPKISAARRAEVQALAAELGYRPDPAFAILGDKRWQDHPGRGSMLIAYIARQRKEWTTFQQACWDGARQRAHALGYDIRHIVMDDFGGPAATATVLARRGYSGVIIRRLIGPERFIGADWRPFSIVGCGLGHYHPPIHVVTPHHARNVEHCWQTLRAAGHQRIAVVLLEYSLLAELPELYLGAALRHQHSLPRRARIEPLLCRENDAQRCQAWLARVRPDAVIGSTDLVHRWLQHGGLSECSFISLERDLSAAGQRTAISGCDLRPHDMGAAAMDLLDISIRRNERGFPELCQHSQIEARWVTGDTVGPMTRTASR